MYKFRVDGYRYQQGCQDANTREKLSMHTRFSYCARTHANDFLYRLIEIDARTSSTNSWNSKKNIERRLPNSSIIWLHAYRAVCRSSKCFSSQLSSQSNVDKRRAKQINRPANSRRCCRHYTVADSKQRVKVAVRWKLLKGAEKRYCRFAIALAKSHSNFYSNAFEKITAVNFFTVRQSVTRKMERCSMLRQKISKLNKCICSGCIFFLSKVYIFHIVPKYCECLSWFVHLTVTWSFYIALQFYWVAFEKRLHFDFHSFNIRTVAHQVMNIYLSGMSGKATIKKLLAEMKRLCSLSLLNSHLL